MELRQLEYFMITCEKGSFNQAAECLYTTQPNVSKVISSLEKELVEKYHAQLDYYGRALEQITGKKVKEKVLYSQYKPDQLTDRSQPGKKIQSGHLSQQYDLPSVD